MSDFVGMSVEEVRRLAKQLDSEADNIEAAEKKVTTKISSSGNIWKGNDANKFRSDWPAKAKQIKEAVQVLRDASKKMQSEAQQQEQTSR